MNQPMLSFRSSNFLQAQHQPVQRLSFPEENRPDPGAFCSTETNRWIARWENEGGAGPAFLLFLRIPPLLNLRRLVHIPANRTPRLKCANDSY